ncbi:hypothetical protein KP509_30G053700 [Ceratopteris richardii]|uniref:Uncharacterized protein n=1 Tax=Ceratopteris richardii TaxID=49495 RepID=A0A8T2R2H4_CERRI|nr:hypothetical protein KP509_30G053700 [Ceratopteris richardii]
MVLNVTNCSADMLADEHPFRADEFLQNPPHYVRRSKIFLGCSRCSLYSSFAVRCLVSRDNCRADDCSFANRLRLLHTILTIPSAAAQIMS